VSCCSPTSFSSAQVSASSTPHTSTPVPLPCAHQRAEIRSGLTLCHKRSVRALVSLPQEQIDARGDREVNQQTARRQRIEYHYGLLREWRGSRGRHGAGDASVDASPACARLWACLAARFPPRLPRLGCRFRGRLCGPAFRGSWRGCPALAKALIVASACSHAVALDRYVTRDVAHVWVGPASTKCAMLSRGGTTHGLGHWEGVSRVVCDRLGVVCELACPLGSAPELSNRLPKTKAPVYRGCEHACSHRRVSVSDTYKNVWPICRTPVGNYYII
jgi:hypothetical protein